MGLLMRLQSGIRHLVILRLRNFQVCLMTWMPLIIEEPILPQANRILEANEGEGDLVSDAREWELGFHRFCFMDDM